MGGAKHSKVIVIRSSTGRHQQRLAISAVGRPHADKIDQSQGRFLPYVFAYRYKSRVTFKFLEQS